MTKMTDRIEDKQERLEDLYIEMHRLEDRIQDIKGKILDLESEIRAGQNV